MISGSDAPVSRTSIKEVRTNTAPNPGSATADSPGPGRPDMSNRSRKESCGFRI